MRPKSTRITRFKHLQQELSKINDDHTKHWSEYPCLEWTRGTNCPNGYGVATTAGRRALVHRAAYELTYGPLADGLKACHHCDNRICFRPIHLFAGTSSENRLDAVAKGRLNLPRGEMHHNAKIAAADVTHIRLLLAKRIPNIRIAKQFGVHAKTIAMIRDGITWSHVALNQVAD